MRFYFDFLACALCVVPLHACSGGSASDDASSGEGDGVETDEGESGDSAASETTGDQVDCPSLEELGYVVEHECHAPGGASLPALQISAELRPVTGAELCPTFELSHPLLDEQGRQSRSLMMTLDGD